MDKAYRDALIVHGAITLTNTAIAARLGKSPWRYAGLRLLSYAIDLPLCVPLMVAMERAGVPDRTIDGTLQIIGHTSRVALYGRAGYGVREQLPLMANAILVSTVAAFIAAKKASR